MLTLLTLWELLNKACKTEEQAYYEYPGSQSRVTTDFVTLTGPRRKQITQVEKWPRSQIPAELKEEALFTFRYRLNKLSVQLSYAKQ